MNTLKLTIMNVVPYQTCPKCNGQGTVSRPPWLDGDVTEWTFAGGSFKCDVCEGAKIIPMYIMDGQCNRVVEMDLQSQTVEKIEKAACETWDVTEEMLRRKTRIPQVVEARKAIMLFRRKANNESLEAIGTDYGLDHSTVLTHVKNFPGIIEFNKDAKTRTKIFLEKLGSGMELVNL